MERLNKWIIRYLALEALYVIIIMIFCVVIWAFREQLTQSNSWITLRRNPRTFLESSLVFICLGNMVGAFITLLVLLRKNRAVITLDNFIGLAINLMIAVIFSPLVLGMIFTLAFASRLMGRNL